MNKIYICWRCLKALESREGTQRVRKHYVYENTPCDCCKESGNDELYELLPEEEKL